MKKTKTIGSFFNFYSSQNKRVQTFSERFENLSIYQAQIFQPGFDFVLNSDFMQNATFICACPSNEPNFEAMDKNPAVVDLKELFFRVMFPHATEYSESLAKLSSVETRLPKVIKDFENMFLAASGETLKNASEYAQLQQSV